MYHPRLGWVGMSSLDGTQFFPTSFSFKISPETAQSSVHLGNSLITAISAVLASALVAFLLYHFIEHPAIQLGKQLSTRFITIGSRA
jgi:peptidoglycan/LPS O-acetylase OafA/YrhL